MLKKIIVSSIIFSLLQIGLLAKQSQNQRQQEGGQPAAYQAQKRSYYSKPQGSVYQQAAPVKSITFWSKFFYFIGGFILVVVFTIVTVVIIIAKMATYTSSYKAHNP